jgi:hypothetical protein
VHTDDRARVPNLPADSTPNAEGIITIGTARWSWHPKSTCTLLPAKELDLRPPYATVTLETEGIPIALDYILLRKIR